jgi:predicted outer membrane repeat protein
MAWSFFGGNGRSEQRNSKKNGKRKPRAARGRRPVFEELESRRVLAVLTVNSLLDNITGGDNLVTLREAIIASNTDTITDLGETGLDADTIQFSPGLNGTITLGGTQISISDAVTITGLGATNLAIDGANTSRIFNITEEVGDVAISGLTFKGGNSGANDGGAIFSNQFGTLAITDSVITGNVADAGGGVYTSGDVTFTGTTIGGIGALANVSTVGGGGVFSYGTVTLRNSTVSGNTAGAGGGGVYSSGTVIVENSTIGGAAVGAGNTSAGNGGGLFGSTVSLLSSNVIGNSGVNGGGIFASSNITLASSTVSGNIASASGGGVYAVGNVTAENTTIGGIAVPAGNTAADDGGGIFASGTVSLTNSTVANNIAHDDGGGILAIAIATLRNSTVTGNKADDDAGGIYSANVTLQNTTIASNTADADNSGNTAGDGIGGGVLASLKFKMVNSIAIGNTDTGDGNPDLKIPVGGASSVRFSLIGDNTGLPAGAQFNVTGPGAQQATTGNIIGMPGGANAIGIGLVLDPAGLQNNGGLTPTIGLLAGSLAVNKGQNSLVVSPSTGDQRGLPFSRISPVAGRVDMGAFELQTATPGNNDPVLANPIADQSATVDSLFVFQIPVNTFTDADGNTLTYTATQVGGAPLPAWLTFNSVSRSFTGTPTLADIGVLNIRVTASDGQGGVNPTDDFTLTVTGNPPPTLVNGIPDQNAAVGVPFTFTFAANTFADPNSDPLTYTATLAGGGALPAWLTFNPATRTFSGTPAGGDVGVVAVRVAAADSSGGSATDDFNITVSTSELPFNENFEGPIDTRIVEKSPGFTTSNASPLNGVVSYVATRPTINSRPVATVDFVNPATAADVTTVNVNVSPGGGNGSTLWSNAVIVFDYVSPTNYKFAGVFEIIDRLIIGQVVNGKVSYLAQKKFPASPNTSIPLSLNINRATNLVTITSGATVVSRTFSALGTGTVGVGTINANARFDNLNIV